MLTTVHPHLTEDQLAKAQALKNSNDFYPDVLVTEQPINTLDGGNFRQLEAITPLQPTALLELKLHSSFTSMTQRYIIDNCHEARDVGSLHEVVDRVHALTWSSSSSTSPMPIAA